ncbi:MAG: hypothetical protein QOC94_922 [Actinoplanes sp.]|jgi:hypothetical protein|nr:hypothetical protein [Actinoplanes sp.]
MAEWSVSVVGVSGPLEPWLRDTAELPTAAAGRLRLLTILGACALMMVALCLGGLWNLNRLSNKSDPPAVAAPQSALPTQATTPDQIFTSQPHTTPPTTTPVVAPKPPVQTVADPPKPTPTPTPTPSRTPVPTTVSPGPPVQTGVRPGALCAPRGAAGITAKGVPVVCRPSAPDDRDRWRKV